MRWFSRSSADEADTADAFDDALLRALAAAGAIEVFRASCAENASFIGACASMYFSRLALLCA